VRAHLSELRAARSWAELEERLGAHRLRLERKGQGLVITDGQHQVKASRVARDLSLRRLEERFRAPYPGREEEQARREPPSRDVAQLQGALAEYERVTALEHEREGAAKELYAAQAQRHELDRAIKAVRTACEDLDRALARVYRDPPAAREQFRKAAAQEGPERTTEWLTLEPERFGALRTVDHKRAFGLGVTRDETPARREAQMAAYHARALTEAVRRAAALAGKEAPDRHETGMVPWVERALAHAKERIAATERRLDELKQELRRAPNLDLLQRSIARVVARLEPREIAHLRALITTPQATIAFQARAVLKDLLLGREEERDT
jgi:predicted  nucleic acid-binding Zn-ribbon protein